MRTETPQIVRLEDYRPSDFLIDRVELDIRLHPTETRDHRDPGAPAQPERAQATRRSMLDGDELDSSALSLDGRACIRGGLRGDAAIA